MASINIKKRIQVNGKWTFAAIAIRNGRRWSDHCIVNGVAEKHPEGVYYIEWYEGKKRTQRPAGKTLAEAMEAAENQEHVLGLRASGRDIEDVVAQQRFTAASKGNSLTVLQASEKFLRDKRVASVKKDSRTIEKYSLILKRFQEYVNPSTMATDVTKDDVIGFMADLQEEEYDNATVKLHGIIARGAMVRAGANIQIAAGDWPKVQEKEKPVYELETLEKFFAACDDDETVLFQTFLHTGFRDSEIGYLTWSDIDFRHNVIKVTAKAALGFTTKNYMIREVPVPETLMDLLAGWKQRSAKKLNPHNLVFPTDPHWQPGLDGGKRDFKMLNKCKDIAYRAGLNCGFCKAAHGDCDRGPYCSDWTLHRFRHTFATYHLQSGTDIRTVQRWMGHKDIKSTLVYLKPARGEQARKAVNNGMLATLVPGNRKSNVVSMAAGGR